MAGPNGAGKSTAAASILPALGVTDFVNADVIARTLGVQPRTRIVASRARHARSTASPRRPWRNVRI